jgi:sugar lactone lactonase YvrE
VFLVIASGHMPARATTAAPAAGTVVGLDVFWPAAIDADAAGRLFVVESGQPALEETEVLRFDPGVTTGVRVAGGSASGLRNYPSGVAVDGSGRIVVADTYNHRVLRFDTPTSVGLVVAGGPGEGTGNAGAGLDRLNNPSKIEVDGSGRLWIADTTNDRVVRWDPGANAGVVVAGGNGRGGAPNQFALPAGVHVEPDGTLYVADTQGHRVMRWDPGAISGVVAAGGNGAGTALDQLRGPGGVDVDADGAVLVADTQNHRVVRWPAGATSGEVVAGGTQGSGLDQLWQPTDVLSLAPGSFVVTDRRNDRVLRFDGGRLHVVASPEARDLMVALAPVIGVTVLPTAAEEAFTVPGCPSPVPLPALDRDYTALLAGVPYLTADGATAPAVPPECAPDAVTGFFGER